MQRQTHSKASSTRKAMKPAMAAKANNKNMKAATKRAKSKPTSIKKSSSAKGPDAITLLKDDHKDVAALFREYDAGKDKMSAARKEKLTEKICEELKIHMQIEEEIFYPAIEEQMADVEEVVGEAKVEHKTFKRLIRDIDSGSPADEEFDSDVKVLSEHVEHHVKEEEEELFPKVRKSGMDLKTLGTAMAKRKKELKTGKVAKDRATLDAVINTCVYQRINLRQIEKLRSGLCRLVEWQKSRAKGA